MSLLLTLTMIAGIMVLFAILARVVMVERRVSRGYSDLERADLAVKAGQADASGVLLHLFTNFPDSATYWEPKIADSNTPGTVFMYQGRSRVSGKQRLNMSNASEPKIYVRPLVSGAQSKEFSKFSETLDVGALSNQDHSIDLNAGDGWIGALPGESPQPVRVPWVEIVEDPTKPKDETTNRVVARYAWWAEDESFRLNVNVAKEMARGTAVQETRDVNGIQENDAKPTFLGLFANDSNAENVAKAVVAARSALQGSEGRFLSASQVAHSKVIPSGTSDLNFAQDYKFILSAYSSGLDLSRSGAKRVNINEVVEGSLVGLPMVSYASPSYGSGGRSGYDLHSLGTGAGVTKAIRQIASAIESNAPLFGQRYYRRSGGQNAIKETNTSIEATAKNAANVVSEDHASKYVLKLATNIYDYVSPLVNPTFIRSGGTMALTSAPTSGQPDTAYSTLRQVGYTVYNLGTSSDKTSPFDAVGKKNIPYLSKYLWRATELSKTEHYADYEALKQANLAGNDNVTAFLATDGIETYDIAIDHYFELWNMSDEEIDPNRGDLGPEPYIVLENQAYITPDNSVFSVSGGVTDAHTVGFGRNFKIKLTDDFIVNPSTGQTEKIRFQPSALTIITTDPDYATRGHIATGAKVYLATALYDPEDGTRVDGAVSKPPFPDPQDMPVKVSNVRLYRINSYDQRDDPGDFGEIQVGPDAQGGASQMYFMGNRYGLLDAAPSIAMTKQEPKNLLNFEKKNSPASAFRASHLSITDPGEWDPRTRLDPLTIRLEDPPKTGSWSATGKFSTMMLAASGKLGELTVNTTQQQKAFVLSDLHPLVSSGSTGVMSLSAANPVADYAGRALLGVGELGRVIDPAIYPHTTTAERPVRRGGGRTLAIGQPDPYWSGTRTSGYAGSELSFHQSASREWVSWRLADIFTVRRDDDRQGTAKAEVEGLYNPNGILRDRGMVLRALLEGIGFGPSNESDPTLTTAATFSTAEIEKGVSASIDEAWPQTVPSGGAAFARYLAQRLTRDLPKRFSPLWEPGELSQLPMFSPYNQTSSSRTQIAAGANVEALNDRGREEVVRRLMELITPKGNTYSLYLVGQALDRKANPIATKVQKVTVRLRPEWSTPPDDTFDPANADARFAMPERWSLEVVSVEDATL